MHLSRFFTLDELTHSNTAKAERIDNQPTGAEAECLRALCTAVLDPLREAVGRGITVNSGYRGPTLNRRLKGASKSQHLEGQAADIQSPGMTVLDLFKTTIRIGLPYDQIIYEVKGASKWVHVSHKVGANEGEILLAKFGADGRVSYERITAPQALEMTEPVTRSRGAPELSYIETADEPERALPVAHSAEVAEAAPKPARKAKAPARKKAAAKKTAKPKKTTRRKPATKKTTAKKVSAKKATAPKKKVPRKTVAKKSTKKKAPAKRVTDKKATAKKATAKKAGAQKKTARRKPAAKKTTAKKTTAKKSTAKKTSTKKVVAAKKAVPRKRAAAKKVAPRKRAGAKAGAKKSTTSKTGRR